MSTLVNEMDVTVNEALSGRLGDVCTIQTTLYELVARVQIAYPEYDDARVVALLEKFLRHRRVTLAGQARVE